MYILKRGHIQKTTSTLDDQTNTLFSPLTKVNVCKIDYWCLNFMSWSN